MRHRFASFLILASVLLFWGSTADPCHARDKAKGPRKKATVRADPPPSPTDPWNRDLWYRGKPRPGNHFLYLPHGGRKRMLVVHVPFGLDGKTRTPVVFLFHGGGGNGRQAQKSYGLDAVADREKFIAVYPYGVGPLKQTGLTWNAKFGWGEAMTKDVDDPGFFLAMLARLGRTLPLDPARVFLTGFSNGACLSYRLGALFPDKVAAIAPVAGAIGGRANEGAPFHVIPQPATPLAVMVIHGLKDESLPYYGGQQTTSFPGTKPTVIVLSVSEAVNFWAKANGCNPTPVITESETKNVATYRYGGGQNGTEVVLMVVKNKGHSWPGGEGAKVDWLENPTQEFKASEVIWEFFKQHPRTGPAGDTGEPEPSPAAPEPASGEPVPAEN